MALVPEDTTSSPPPPRPGAADKVRLVFRKGGPLRWLSHHDLLRTFERMLRRAEVPFHRSQGFNPHARIVFALSLPLGVVGRAEIVDVELARETGPQAVLQALARHCPPGLEILEARRVPVKSGVRVVGLWYGLTVPPPLHDRALERIAETLAAAECLVQRQKPVRRQVNVRPFLKELRLAPDSGWLDIGLHLTPAGTARPDEVLGLLGLSGLLDDGAVLERTRLDLQDDTLSAPPPAAPEGEEEQHSQEDEEIR